MQVDRAKVLSNTVKQKRKHKAGKWDVPLPKVRGTLRKCIFMNRTKRKLVYTTTLLRLVACLASVWLHPSDMTNILRM